jgi:hypothetical protein
LELKETTMKWFKRMVCNWVREDWNQTSRDQVAEKYAVGAISKGGSGRTVDADPTLQFKIYEAIGGKVVEFSRYDRRTDRHDHCIYVIGKGEDFGEKIAKIATLETLK